MTEPTYLPPNLSEIDRLRIELAAAREREVTAALVANTPATMDLACRYPSLGPTISAASNKLVEDGSLENHLAVIDKLLKLAGVL